MSRDWRAWHQQYDDASSSLRRRLGEVRRLLAADLDERAAAGQTSVRLLSLCAGDGRDTIPVLAERSAPVVDACLIELDAELASAARSAASEAGLDIDVRTGDAGSMATFRDRLHNDVPMLCGIFGNVSSADVERSVEASRALVAAGGTVIWTRASTEGPSDAATWVRGLFVAAGYDEGAYVAPADATYRVGVCRLPPGATPGGAPSWSFTFQG